MQYVDPSDHATLVALASIDLRDEPCVEGFENIELVSDLEMLEVLVDDREFDEYEPTQDDLDSFHEFIELAEAA